MKDLPHHSVELWIVKSWDIFPQSGDCITWLFRFCWVKLLSKIWSERSLNLMVLKLNSCHKCKPRTEISDLRWNQAIAKVIFCDLTQPVLSLLWVVHIIHLYVVFVVFHFITRRRPSKVNLLSLSLIWTFHYAPAVEPTGPSHIILLTTFQSLKGVLHINWRA